ncbi:UNVERIFIED_CONTAM: hypothetical protein Sradi_3861100 [Sesamum radiatum]|uniref:Reverse transcriptase n=1 Tax=Sesamum radiatum TaxID=300843 RepID=A0AAW2Q1T1_SESRA
MPIKLTETMNPELLRPLTKDEVKQALDEMHSFKSSGLTFNHANIILLPKCTNPEYVTAFWTISLYNVIKILVSKALANCIKPFLYELISDSQSAFVPSHLVTENVLVAYKLKHYLSHKYRNRIQRCSSLPLMLHCSLLSSRSHLAIEEDLILMGLALKLMEEKDIGLELLVGFWQGEPEIGGFYLVQRLLLRKALNFDATRSALRTAFNPIKRTTYKFH